MCGYPDYLGLLLFVLGGAFQWPRKGRGVQDLVRMPISGRRIGSGDIDINLQAPLAHGQREANTHA